MSTETSLVTIERPRLNGSIVPMSSGTEAIQSAIETLKSLRSFVAQEMKPDVDFGVIPGTSKKNVLFLPGAQKTALYFNCTARFTHLRHELGNGHLEVESLCLLEMRSSGTVVAEGSGTCSTMESKYRTRNGERLCPACGKASIIQGKKEYGGGWICYGKKGGCGLKFQDGDPSIEGQAVGRVENPDIWDVRNTVLKMSAKRAQVAAALNLGAMSELFTQDIEEPHLSPSYDERPRDSGRDEINEQFKPAPPAKEKDSRTLATIIADGSGHVEAEFRATYPGSTQKLPGPWQVARHCYRLASEQSPPLLEAVPNIKSGAVMRELSSLYGTKEGRKFLRAEVTRYLGLKLNEARAREVEMMAADADAQADDEDEAGDIAASFDNSLKGDAYDEPEPAKK